ncbi:dihydrofolate reductase family protein [Gordonia paraffinivorans]|uniref:dihydrofolate reductase family protein n=1 Tax=Gordonia paraffinivorans TaxID=175628 RepID=UPI0024312408|nr:dihydrofolate reductase family protein [Gordonia paraffinivorans]
MFHLHKATQVTPDEGESETLRQLARQYPYPPRAAEGPGARAPYVRANMVTSIDGAVTVEGRSGGLGGPGDNAVFRTLRGLADVILVGAGTAITEGYRLPEPDAVFAELRAGNGQAPAPALALVSRSLSIPPDYAPLTHENTVVLTCAAAPADRRAALLDAGATLVDCGDDTVETEEIIAECGRREWPRVLCEGGPRLLGAVVAADLLDELCLTTSPVLAGGDAGRIVADTRADGAGLASRGMTPAAIMSDDDGFVFTRWVRHDRSSSH